MPRRLFAPVISTPRPRKPGSIMVPPVNSSAFARRLLARFGETSSKLVWNVAWVKRDTHHHRRFVAVAHKDGGVRSSRWYYQITASEPAGGPNPGAEPQVGSPE